MRQNDRTTIMDDRQEHVDFDAIFTALPTICAVLTVPGYRIVAATDAFCRVVYRTRDEVVGTSIADVLPNSPSMPHAAARGALLDVLDHVLRTKGVVNLGIVRYDVMCPDSIGGGTEEHWWRVNASPVLDDRQEVEYIIYVAEEVSQVLDTLEELERAARRRVDR